MADGMNKAILIGNLGADPELKYTPGNQAVLKLRLATSESFLGKDGSRQTRTEWHTVVVWGKRAEALDKILAKGRTICVEGSISYRQWEDQQGGKRYATDIIAREIVLLGGGQRRDDGADRGRDQGGYRGGSHGRGQQRDFGDFGGGDFGGGDGDGYGDDGLDPDIPF